MLCGLSDLVQPVTQSLLAMEFISTRTQQLLAILDLAKHSLSLRKNNTSSRLGTAVLGKDELESFLQDAWNLYVNAIKSGLEENYFIIQETCVPNKNVFILNTGSIAEKFGGPRHFHSKVEPLESYDQEDPKHPKQLLKSDHDLMFVLEALVVCNKLPNVTNLRLEIEPNCSPGFEHFVQIYSINQDKSKTPLTNTLANNYISSIVESAFFEEKRVPTRLGNRLKKFIQKNMLGKRCGNPHDLTEIKIVQEGPSVNMKVTMRNRPDNILLDCDFL